MTQFTLQDMLLAKAGWLGSAGGRGTVLLIRQTLPPPEGVPGGIDGDLWFNEYNGHLYRLNGPSRLAEAHGAGYHAGYGPPPDPPIGYVVGDVYLDVDTSHKFLLEI